MKVIKKRRRGELQKQEYSSSECIIWDSTWHNMLLMQMEVHDFPSGKAHIVKDTRFHLATRFFRVLISPSDIPTRKVKKSVTAMSKNSHITRAFFIFLFFCCIQRAVKLLRFSFHLIIVVMIMKQMIKKKYLYKENVKKLYYRV